MKNTLIVLITLFLNQSAFAQTDTSFKIHKLSEHILSSYYYRVAVHEHTIAIIECHDIYTYDFSNPKNLQKNSGMITCATLEVPRSPEILIGGLREPRYDDIAIQWPYLFVPTTEFLQIFDLGDPASFKQASLYKPLPENFGVGSVRVSGERALYTYKTDREWILEILDISDIQSPKGEGQLVLPNPPSEILWDGGRYAFIFPDATKITAGLQAAIVDVSDPKHPYITSSISIDDYSVTAYPPSKYSAFVNMDNNIIICNAPESSSGKHAVRAYDISNPETPVFISSKSLEVNSENNFPSSLYEAGNQWIGQNALGNSRIGGGWIGLYQLKDAIPVLAFRVQYNQPSRLVAKIEDYLLFVFVFTQPYLPPPPKLILTELILPSSLDGFSCYQ